MKIVLKIGTVPAGDALSPFGPLIAAYVADTMAPATATERKPSPEPKSVICNYWRSVLVSNSVSRNDHFPRHVRKGLFVETPISFYSFRRIYLNSNTESTSFAGDPSFGITYFSLLWIRNAPQIPCLVMNRNEAARNS